MATDPALQQAQSALAPILAEIERQKQEEAKRAANAQATAGASAQGLSQVLAPIPGQIQQDYQNAGDSTSAYAKGFSTAFQEGSEQVAADLNAFLAKQGGPQQVTSAGSKGADVLYGLGGYIPASTLAREGAAFTAAGRGLGAAALGRGQEAQNLIGRESREKVAQLNVLRRQEKGKYPGLVSDARAQIADQKLKNRAQKLNELLAVENLGIKQSQLGISQQNANTSAASVKLRASKQKFDQALSSAKLSLDEEQLGLAWKREERLSKPKAKGGFTAKQKQELQQTALDTARDDFLGYEDDQGNTVPPRPPVETLRDLIGSGVPFSLAIKAIQRFARGSKPATVDARMWALWRATLKWTKK